MKNKVGKYLLILVFTSPFFFPEFVPAQGQMDFNNGGKDTVPALHYNYNDSRLPYQPTENPLGLNLKLPSNFSRVIDFDPVRNEYIFREKIGKIDYIVPYAMSLPDYLLLYQETSNHDYWMERRKNDKMGVNNPLIPNLNLGGEAFNNIFGNNSINIVPQGSAELIFSLNTVSTQNPVIPQDLRTTTTFDFKEKIQMNVTGTVGDKLKVGINYNTESTFDFENTTKLEYTGKEDDIVKKIEAGNITMPLTGTLITGSQTLFGLKTELQFGKLKVTSVVSQQQGQSTTIQLNGGAQVTNFSIPIDQYDANKHYFLSEFFRDNYETALRDLPVINSAYTITQIEVWVTNKTGNYTNARNIVALVDLGETKHIFNTIPQFQPSPGTTKLYPRNDANGLYASLSGTGPYNVRNFTNISNALSSLGTGHFYNDRDYEILGSARMLTPKEYTLNARLGYISLNAALNSDEILAVAYQYVYEGKTYYVGELSSTLATTSTLITKLLKQATFNPQDPNWNLMMKNVYALNAYQISNTNFMLNILYQDDRKGTTVNYIPEPQTDNEILLSNVFGLDRLNTNLDFVKGGDGFFDFVEGATVNSSNGRIFFPTLEPFNTTLQTYLLSKNVSPNVINNYIYPQLYDSTQTAARQLTQLDKFILKGSYQSNASASDIPLNATNIPQGSVVVTAGGRKLVENQDYTVDYTLGRVKIINPGLMESGTPITITVENNSLFNLQTKTLLGSHLDYKFNDNLTLGGTILNYTERPLTQKVNIGDEPVSNTIWGLNGNYSTKSQLITNWLNKVPLLSLKDPSSFTADAEFAQLIPGQASAINNTAYIDDFESSETTIDLKIQSSWFLASTPADLSLFPESQLTNNLGYGYNRARISWYVIDPLLSPSGFSSLTPSYIQNTPSSYLSHFVRMVNITDIFTNVETATGLPSTLPIMNVAFYPKERGPYNYDGKNVNPDGTLKNPKNRWGGIQRQIVNTDFEAANIEYIEFWLMNPFIADSLQHTNPAGGYLYFDLGDVSEDVLKDGQKSYENGLPVDNSLTAIDSTAWGYVSTNPTLSTGFTSSDPQSVINQDVGLDGLSDAREQRYFRSFLDSLKNISSTAYQKAYVDPSSDDFHYYVDDPYESPNLGILARYKYYGNPEGNSKPSTGTETLSSTSIPNTEDINNDNTLSQTESFFQYRVQLTPSQLKIGSNFIVDSVVTPRPQINNSLLAPETWYQFRIPIQQYEKIVGSIQDFKTIRFMRMFLTGFQDSVILRFARLQLVRGDWRLSDQNLKFGGENNSTPSQNVGNLNISAVNIENNSTQCPVNYVLPPGINRQSDPSNPQLAQLNEQSMVLKVTNMANGDAFAAYKTSNLDLRNYGHLIMDVHEERVVPDQSVLQDSDLSVFLRMGSDDVDNFYEYDVPLNLTPQNCNYNNNSVADRETVWPESNRLDFDLDALQQAKLARDAELNKTGAYITYQTIFPYQIKGLKGTFYVRGNPNTANIKTLMIGIRYPGRPGHNGATRNATVWVDELRVTNFKNKSGWAAEVRTSTKLSSLGTLNVSGGILTPGFGGLEQKIGQRSLDEVVHYNISSNLELGRFFPTKSRISIPMFVSLSQSFSTPEYNPLDPDILLSTELNTVKSKRQRDSIMNLVQDVITRKSLNFTNVKINRKGGTSHFWDISNFSLNYSFISSLEHNVNYDKNLDKTYRGGLNYTYQMKPKSIAPLQKIPILKNKDFRILKDFNFQPLPNLISFKTEMIRHYNEVHTRNLDELGGGESSLLPTPPAVNKDFLWNRNYQVGWDLTKSLKIDFTAVNNSRIDEPYGVRSGNVVNEYLYSNDYHHWKDSVWHQILNGGRTIHYTHTLNVNYTIPINKLPMLDWTSASARYNTAFNWTAQNIDTSRIKLGNTIDNSNTFQLKCQLNFVTLYNKVPYFKKLFLTDSKKAKLPKKFKTVTYERQKTFIMANQPKVINHKLLTEDVTVKVYDSDGKEIKGKMDIINPNKITFTTDEDYTGVRIVVTGKIEEKPSPILFIVENFTRIVLSVKTVSVSYSTTSGSVVPGYLPGTRFLGTETEEYSNAPGLPFLFGYQDPNFAHIAMKSGWISKSPYQNLPYQMNYSQNVNLQGNLEPIPGLKIELSALHSYTSSQSSYYDTATYSLINPIQTGTFSMSFLALRSSFENLKAPNFYSPTFQHFLNYRFGIAQRLAFNRQSLMPNSYVYHIDPVSGYPDGYGPTDQEVLIPAFMAAYGNINPNKVSLDRIPSLWSMMPNWTLKYDGLTKIKFLEQYFRSITISDSYRATYNIGNYIATPDTAHDDFNYILSTLRDLQNNFIPKINITAVSITEQFAPLFGIDVNLKNSLSGKLEFRRSRTLGLSIANSQIIETNTNEFIIGSGYKIQNFTLIKTAAGQKGYKTALNLRADLSIRDSKTIIRPLDSTPAASTGADAVSLMISADYVLSKNFNMRAFYDRKMNTPLVTGIGGYPTTNSDIGISMRFSLTK